MGVPPQERQGVPGLVAQMSYLPPGARIGAGSVMLAMGGIAIAVQPLSFWAFVLLLVTAAIGVPLLLGGLADRRRRAIESVELARAKAELPELRLAIAAERTGRRNVGKLLRDRGYTTDKVRRWIALECDVVLPRGER
jgi:hypothetical protein